MPVPNKSNYSEYWVKQTKKLASFVDEYEGGEELGRGPTSVVFRCQRRGLPRIWAGKAYYKHRDKRIFKPADAAIALGIQHKNIAYLRDVFESKAEFVIVQELLTGGEVLQRLETLEPYKEEAIAGIAKQIIEGLAYLHGVGLAHRNLKPSNLMYASEAPDAPIKICDYGLSSFAKVETDMIQVCKNPVFTAPEILKGYVYDMACDYWSLGVILYIMLCGYPPIYDDDPGELYKKIIKGNIEFNSPAWDQITDSGKDIVKRMLRYKPGERLSPGNALKTVWVNGICIESEANLTDARETLKYTNEQRWNRPEFAPLLPRNFG